MKKWETRPGDEMWLRLIDSSSAGFCLALFHCVGYYDGVYRYYLIFGSGTKLYVTGKNKRLIPSVVSLNKLKMWF